MDALPFHNSPTMAITTDQAADVADAAAALAADAMGLHDAASARTFKYVTMVVLLVITIVSALLPLWVSAHGTAASRSLMSRKLPFVTAGVFLG